MEPALWTSKTGLDAQQTRMQVISNNLANVSTTGFKRGRPAFADLMYQTVRQPGAQSSQNTQLPSGLMLGTGVRIMATEKIFTQGNIIQTDNPLDIAIQGRGFLQVAMPDGSVAYTRDGSLQLDSTGRIVTAAGYEVQPAMTVPQNVLSISIANDGTVSVMEPGNTAPTQLGNIQLADFVNVGGLQAIGENLFKETAASGTAQPGTPGQTGMGTLLQGSLESSNVNVVEELVNMIETQRAYEMNSKSIERVDQMLQYVTNNI